jgi:hypothetical protein
MSIAESHFFRKDHIQTHAFDAPTSLAEQAVHCLELVAQLNQTGLSFQFKGGNSLLLILDTPKRFSIDVDIATDETRERIEECLNVCVKEFEIFTKWEKRQHKTKPWLPIASYFLFYNSHFQKPEDAFIMLDVQLKRSPYKTEMKSIVCGQLYQANCKTELPLPASIIGDKLLTMGPFSLGIPLGKGKEAQRLKHVYDVSTLCRTMPHIDDIRMSFFACLEHENSLQEKKIAAEDVCMDTLRFCASVLQHDTCPSDTNALSGVLRENAVGIDAFANHLFDHNYFWPTLQGDMARVAMCISAVCRDQVSDSEFHLALQAPTAVAATLAHLKCTDDVRRSWATVTSWIGKDIFVTVEG